ncbi:MAG TPA: YhdH/YhfP family quinone oxidoreductase [Flavitalea sp.]|nr:YhdH/YhfP family quinone oxidoreductase [Flavitalea sp.]
MNYKALWVTENEAGTFQRSIVSRDIEELPDGDVLIRVEYSSLNYKDALSATGNKGITKTFPHTPGIDAAGVVAISRDPLFVTGEEVVVTGHDLGMNTPGGFGGYIKVPGSWIMHKPEGYSLKDCMAIGTAGFTAACALFKMELLGQQSTDGEIVVTGSSGGVGSIATALLCKAGYNVVAVTGKREINDYLRFLGAVRVESREYVNDQSTRKLLPSKWSGAIDTVGGNTLHTLLRGCKPEGVVVSTGLVESPDLRTSVYPLILNGVSLVGIGSAETPPDTRKAVWEKLSTSWNIKEKLATIASEISLQQLTDTYIDKILAGQMTGRVVINLNL